MALLTGRTLGRYRLDAVLGQGGMAAVYKAIDTKLGRAVAVKVILPSHSHDAQFRERFLQEANVVAQLDHPNILPIYDYGEEDGLPYLVMPFLDGGTLRDRMPAGRAVPLPQAISWVSQLAEALDAAHASGVLHRDVKPSNVLIGKSDRLALADFGIAKLLESTTGLTATGMAVGTPIYMAPEQAQGRKATPASDRYALGVLAYEILTGAPPFQGENALSLMHQHVATPPPLATARVATLPADLDRVLARALSKEPEARHSSCRAFAEALAGCIPGGSGSLEKPTVSWVAGSTLDATVAAETPVGGGSRVVRPSPSGGTPVSTGEMTAAMTPPSAPAPVSVSTGTPSMPTAATVLGSGRRGRAWLAASLVAAAVVAIGLWRILGSGGSGRVGQRGEGPSDRAVVVGAATQREEPLVSTTPVVEPPIEMQEVGQAGSVDLEDVQEKASRAAEKARLKAELATAMAAGRLAPPSDSSAVEALDELRSAFPRDPETVAAEKRLVAALKAEAGRRLEARDVAGAIDLLAKAQVLDPKDTSIQGSLRVAEGLLKASMSSASNAAPGVPSTGPSGPTTAAPPFPAPPAPAPPAAPGLPGLAELEPSSAALQDTLRRLDPARNGGRRPTVADFTALRELTREALRRDDRRPETQFLSRYAEGGLAYLGGNEQRAATLLAACYTDALRSGRRDLRGLMLFVRQAGGSFAPPHGWRLALSYADAKGEARRLLEPELSTNRADPMVWLGLGYLEELDQKPEAALGAVDTAWDHAKGTELAGLTATCAGHLCSRLGKIEMATSWFETACREGSVESCREVGAAPPVRPRDRRVRQGRRG